MTKESLFVGIDPGLYTTTAVIMNCKCEIKAVRKIFSCEAEYPRKKKLICKSRQRKFDPICDTIAIHHWDFLDGIICRFQPKAIACENMSWNEDSTTSTMVGHFRGIMHGVAIFREVTFKLIDPKQVKITIASNGNANKNEVCQRVWEQYGNQLEKFDVFNVGQLKKFNHIADALGVCVTLVQQEMHSLDDDIEESFMRSN